MKQIYKVEKSKTVTLDEVWLYDKSDMTDQIEIRAVVEDGGNFEAKGMLKIAKNVSNIDVFLRYKVLLLGSGAKANVVPQLEIESNEVKAGHAASVGQIDEDQLFYLMSRGLERDEAVELVVKAFLNDEL